MKMVNWLWKKNPKQPKEEQEVDEEELKKKGFNPEGIEVEQVKESDCVNYDSDFQDFISPAPEEAQQIIAAFKQHCFHSDSSRTTRSIAMIWPTPREARYVEINRK